MGSTRERCGTRSAGKKIIDDQQESLSKWESMGRRFKGRRKGNKAVQVGLTEGKVRFQDKKTKCGSDDKCDKNGAAGPIKRARGETKASVYQSSRKQKIVMEASNAVNNILKIYFN